MATMQSAQMSKREKIKYLAQILYDLSDSSSRKGVYSILEIAKALYSHIVDKVSWAKLPKSEHYRRETAYQYWYKKLKDSGRFQEVKKVII